MCTYVLPWDQLSTQEHPNPEDSHSAVCLLLPEGKPEVPPRPQIPFPSHKSEAILGSVPFCLLLLLHPEIWAGLLCWVPERE